MARVVSRMMLVLGLLGAFGSSPVLALTAPHDSVEQAAQSILPDAQVAVHGNLQGAMAALDELIAEVGKLKIVSQDPDLSSGLEAARSAMDGMLAQIATESGMDLRKDVGSVTLSFAFPSADQVQLLVRVRADRNFHSTFGSAGRVPGPGRAGSVGEGCEPGARRSASAARAAAGLRGARGAEYASRRGCRSRAALVGGPRQSHPSGGRCTMGSAGWGGHGRFGAARSRRSWRWALGGAGRSGWGTAGGRVGGVVDWLVAGRVVRPCGVVVDRGVRLTGLRQRGGCRRHPEVRKDPPHDPGVCQEGEDDHGRRAPGAGERVHVERSEEQRRPREASSG